MRLDLPENGSMHEAAQMCQYGLHIPDGFVFVKFCAFPKKNKMKERSPRLETTPEGAFSLGESVKQRGYA